MSFSAKEQRSAAREPELYVDAAGVDRREIHEAVIAKAVDLFQV